MHRLLIPYLIVVSLKTELEVHLIWPTMNCRFKLSHARGNLFFPLHLPVFLMWQWFEILTSLSWEYLQLLTPREVSAATASASLMCFDRFMTVTYSHYQQYTWIYIEIRRGENGRCSQGWTAVHSHASKAVHGVMPGGVGGWVAVRPLRCYETNAHNNKNGGNIYNARNCGISIDMKIFLLYFRYWKQNSRSQM